MLGIVGLIFAVLVAVLFIRAMRFKPKTEKAADFSTETFDEKKAIEHLQALIRCKTVSYRNKELEDNVEFEKLEFEQEVFDFI